MNMITENRMNELKQKLTLFTGSKGEGGVVFTFEDFYDIESIIDFQMGHYKCPMCGGLVSREQKSVKAVWGDYETVVKRVGVDVCGKCGEWFYDLNTARLLQEIAVRGNWFGERGDE